MQNLSKKLIRKLQNNKENLGMKSFIWINENHSTSPW